MILQLFEKTKHRVFLANSAIALHSEISGARSLDHRDKLNSVGTNRPWATGNAPDSRWFSSFSPLIYWWWIARWTPADNWTVCLRVAWIDCSTDWSQWAGTDSSEITLIALSNYQLESKLNSFVSRRKESHFCGDSLVSAERRWAADRTDEKQNDSLEPVNCEGECFSLADQRDLKAILF